jgi:uracil-DNA glycosylase
LLSEPHIAPLTKYVADLRKRHDSRRKFPDFDPCDGGVDATILFLLEKPGPMTDAFREGKPGSGFVSRNNDDFTAEWTCRFMECALIPRRSTLIWNVIPWWDERIGFSFNKAIREEVLEELDRLLRLLPQLHTVVLVGRTAQKVRDHLRDLRVIRSFHPSAKVRGTNRAKWDSIPGIWQTAGSLPMPV